MGLICSIYEQPLVRAEGNDWSSKLWVGRALCHCSEGRVCRDCSNMQHRLRTESAADSCSHQSHWHTGPEPEPASGKSSQRSQSLEWRHRVIWSLGSQLNIDIQDWRTVISSSDLVTQSEGGNFSQVEFRTRGECYSPENAQMWGKYFLFGKMCY